MLNYLQALAEKGIQILAKISSWILLSNLIVEFVSHFNPPGQVIYFSICIWGWKKVENEKHSQWSFPSFYGIIKCKWAFWN